VVWIGAAALAAIFVLAGTAKLSDHEGEMSRQFAAWGYPDWFRYVVAVAELAGAALLLAPRVAWVGAAALAVVMVGAVWTHLAHNQTGEVAVPVLLLCSLLTLIYLRWPRGANPPPK
jgi:uncharacterized membrane protein YphA (DoxX/SURF4 family)